MNNELKNKTDKELCAIATMLKQKLLESRFKMASGELEKPHVINQVRKAVAQVLTELRSRDLTVSIGSHGVYLHNLKDNSVNIVKEEHVKDFVEKAEKELEKTQVETNAKDIEATAVEKKVTKKENK